MGGNWRQSTLLPSTVNLVKIGLLPATAWPPRHWIESMRVLPSWRWLDWCQKQDGPWQSSPILRAISVTITAPNNATLWLYPLFLSQRTTKINRFSADSSKKRNWIWDCTRTLQVQTRLSWQPLPHTLALCLHSCPILEERVDWWTEAFREHFTRKSHSLLV